jgi:trimeric autotransporter adhesin
VRECLGWAATWSNLYVEEEIVGNRFKIDGGKQGMKISWQITGIRNDHQANKTRVKIERETLYLW